MLPRIINYTDAYVYNSVTRIYLQTLNLNVLSNRSCFFMAGYLSNKREGQISAILNLYRRAPNIIPITVYPRFCQRRRGLLKGTLQCLTKLCKYKRTSCTSGHKRSTIRCPALPASPLVGKHFNRIRAHLRRANLAK